jgi:hypothetical protein
MEKCADWHVNKRCNVYSVAVRALNSGSWWRIYGKLLAIAKKYIVENGFVVI